MKFKQRTDWSSVFWLISELMEFKPRTDWSSFQESGGGQILHHPSVQFNLYQGEVLQYKPGTRDWVDSTQSLVQINLYQSQIHPDTAMVAGTWLVLEDLSLVQFELYPWLLKPHFSPYVETVISGSTLLKKNQIDDLIFFLIFFQEFKICTPPRAAPAQKPCI